MIRDATPDDIPALIDMGLRFHEGSAYFRLFQPSKAAVAETLRGLIASEIGAVFVDEGDGVLRGAILGLIARNFITGEQVCGELSWWVDPEHRGLAGPRLHARLETWAREMGAVRISMTEPPGNPSVGRFLGRAGYQCVEIVHMKAL